MPTKLIAVTSSGLTRIASQPRRVRTIRAAAQPDIANSTGARIPSGTASEPHDDGSCGPPNRFVDDPAISATRAPANAATAANWMANATASAANHLAAPGSGGVVGRVRLSARSRRCRSCSDDAHDFGRTRHGRNPPMVVWGRALRSTVLTTARLHRQSQPLEPLDLVAPLSPTVRPADTTGR